MFESDMDLGDADLEQFAEADRRAVDPPIQVETATWSNAGQLDWWVKERQGWCGRVRGADGRLSIFVPVTAHSHNLLGLHSLEAQSVRDADHRLGTSCVDLVTTISNDIADLSRVERICHAKGVRPARNGAPARSGA